jgi:signal transduction histidine kinase
MPSSAPIPLAIVGNISALLDKESLLRFPGIAVPLVALRPDARGEEIAIISHELRNSLGVIRNATRLLRLDKNPAGIDGARMLIERHVLQMTRHIEDLLDTSRPVGTARVLHLARLDLRTIIEQCISGIASDLKRRGHRLVVSLPADPVWVHADGARLEQVFSNLLNNAAKYTPNGGEIRVMMERVDKLASVRIRDSGVGIAAALLPTVFNMFVQVDAKAVRSEGGSGIGLAVVRNLIELHDGTVHAASAGLGAGSEFTVILPAFWAPPGEGSPAASEC